MARAQGSRSIIAAAFETVYGTAPGAGYKQMPFATSSLGADQPLLDSDLLGFGRDPLEPIKDAETVDGGLVIPMDAENLGFWLKSLFGQPTSAGVVAATGSFTFSAQPLVNSTISVGGTTFTFVASGAVGNQVNIGANLAATMTALAVVLNASVVPGVAAATYSATATAIDIVHDTLGVAGNAFALARSTTPASNATVSAATLTRGANSHIFESGFAVLPSLAIEVQMPEVPRYAMYSGVMAEEFSFELKRSGLLTANLKLQAQRETVASSAASGILSAYALNRFGNFNGSISRNGVAMANVVMARMTYKNGLERIESIRADGAIEGLDPTMASLTGQLEARFSDLVLFNQAIAGDPCSLAFTLSLGPSASMLWEIHEVYLPRPRVAVEGPGGIQATFEWQAAKERFIKQSMCTVTLINTEASY